MKKINYLCYFIVMLTVVSTLVGILYSTEGDRFIVENIYGESIELYGDGIYKYNSVFKAGVNKGTDLVMFIAAIVFAIFTALSERAGRYKYWQVGVLAGLLYYSSCLVFGITFNRLFPVYLFLFSSSLFAMIFLLAELIREDDLSESLKANSLKGTAIFLIVSGSSVLVWLEFILPAIITGEPLSHIEIYTTEPTFVFDLGIILPTYVGCGIALFKKKPIGYKLAPVLLTFITIIGFIVIGQNIFQSSMGIDIPVRELIVLVISFVILGIIATILNVKLMKHMKTEKIKCKL